MAFRNSGTFWCLIFGCLWFPGNGQVNVEGRVLAKSDSTALSNIQVILLPNGQSVQTRENGSFTFKKIQKGPYQIVVYPYEYETFQQDFTIGDKDTTLAPIYLGQIEVNLSTVEVRSEQETLFGVKRLRSVEGTAIYASKKSEVVLIDRLTANLAANNARQIYSQVAGLNIYEQEDAGLQLSIGGRGLDPNRTASFNTRQNGYDISADVLGYPESYYSPPAEALQEIRLIRGAASLQYGTQFGGLIDFVFKKPNPDKPIELISRQTIGSFGLFTSFNRLSGTMDKWSYQAFFNYKEGNGFRDHSAFEAKNLFGQIQYQLSPKTVLNAEYTRLDYLAQQAGGLTDAQFYENPDFSNRTRNWFEVKWNLWALKLTHRFSPKTNLSLQYFGLDASRNAVGFRTNRVSQTDDLNAPRDLIKGTFQNWGAEGRLLHRYQIKEQPAVLLLGTKLYQSDNTAIQGPGTNGNNPDFSLASQTFDTYPNQSAFTFPNFNLAFFGEHIFYLNRRWSITPGFRLEHIQTASEGTYRKIDFNLAGTPIQDQTFEDNRTFERTFVLVGVGGSFKPKPEQEVYVNFSQNYRSVTFNDIRVVNPSFQIDPNISDEKGFTADIGFRGRNKRLSFDLSGYGLLYDDRLGEVLRAETRQNADGSITETGRVIRFRGNIGQAFIYGFESTFDVNIINKKLNLQKSLQLNVFLNNAITHSQYIKSEIPGVQNNEVEFIPFINFKGGFRFRLNQVTSSLQFSHLSKQFTDASNARQDKNDNQSGIIGNIPGYQVLDWSIAYTWRLFRLETGLNNIANQRYFTRRATGYPGPGIIPAAPRSGYLTLAIKW